MAGTDVQTRPQNSREPLLSRTVPLAAKRESAGLARRALRAALEETERARWLDSAELALSEVVTNAVLHAHTEIEVEIQIFEDCVCVEVRDQDSTPPVARHYGSEAITGRGMELVVRLTSRCGVHRTDEGKSVWFCVDDSEPSQPSDDEILAAWDVDGWDLGGLEDQSVDTRRIVLRNMPTTLWMAAREHHDAILRDVHHLLTEQGETEFDIVGVDRARSTISATLVGVLSEMDDPPEALDLEITVPSDGAPTFAAMQDLLDYSEQLAVEGRLLVRPGLPEVVAVRDWACEQVIAQLAGVAPSPWLGAAQEKFETEVLDPRLLEWDTAQIDQSGKAVIAADDANRIIAVSDSFLSAVGWGRDELVGRRIVTLVPPELREAHVAGFSRHLTTGEAHVIGTPIELPVLTHDGDRLVCRILIEQAASDNGRSVYIAWVLDPE